MLDYEVLRIIWWGLLGVLLAGFAIMDGFDLGVGMLLPLIARTDIERRVVINTVGPVWEGNQVWIILGGGAIFAAWPYIYAISFSGFYLAMLLVLIGFILRPVGFKYRSKLTSEAWRQSWDYILAIAAFIPSLIFGVALGNVLQGVPFHFDNELRAFYTGSFWALLNPFAILCGLVSVLMLLMHGAAYLSVKTDGVISQRAIKTTRYCAVTVLILFIVAGVWIANGIDGYVVTSPVVADGYSNPLHKTVITQLGAWTQNFKHYPVTLVAPLLAIFGAIGVFFLAGKGSSKLAFVISSLAVFGIVTTVGVSMFPFILPSSTDLSASLLVWDASSSQLTLFIMLIATAIFLPIILLYTAWVYHVLKGKVTEKSILDENKTMY